MSDTAFRALPMNEQIRRAMPIAREIVADGLTSISTKCEAELLDHIGGLWGRPVPTPDERDLNLATYDAIQTAFAIGVACGTFTRPELFKGGAR
jgi:hypothetical protein